MQTFLHASQGHFLVFSNRRKSNARRISFNHKINNKLFWPTFSSSLIKNLHHYGRQSIWRTRRHHSSGVINRQRANMVRDLTVSTLHPRNTKTRWTPPFRRLPGWERSFWGCFMFVGILSGPAYILYHLPDYRGGVGLHKSYLRKQAREAAKAEQQAQSN